MSERNRDANASVERSFSKELKRKKSKSKSRHRESSSESPKRKKSKHHRSKRKRKRNRSSSSDSSTDSSNSSYLSSSSSSPDRKRQKKLKKRKEKKSKKKKKHKHKHKKSKSHLEKMPSAFSKDAKPVDDREGKDVSIGPAPVVAPVKASMKPMTKEEWEKQQSIVRRVYDPETGRNRLVKGDGEILEEIVSKDRHREINKQATQGDGTYFQARLGISDK